MDFEELIKSITRAGEAVSKLPAEIRLEAFRMLVGSDQIDGARPKTRRTNKAPIKPTEKGSASTRRRSKSGKEIYHLDPNLDLRGGKESPSFKEFFATKQPKTTAEVNVVAAYYLEKICNLSSATLDQIFTCYKEVGKRPAEHFRQSIIDTKNKQGWLEFGDDGETVRVTHRGNVTVEHDLPTKND